MRLGDYGITEEGRGKKEEVIYGLWFMELGDYGSTDF